MPLLGAGLSATLGQLALTRAYGLAPAAYVGPFTYMVAPFSSLVGWLFWSEHLDTESLVGAGIVVGTCILISVYRQEPRLDG